MEEISLQLSILPTQNLVVHITRYSVALLFRCRPIRGHQESPTNHMINAAEGLRWQRYKCMTNTSLTDENPAAACRCLPESTGNMRSEVVRMAQVKRHKYRGECNILMTLFSLISCVVYPYHVSTEFCDLTILSNLYINLISGGREESKAKGRGRGCI
jgi:hypothetical protein